MLISLKYLSLGLDVHVRAGKLYFLGRDFPSSVKNAFMRVTVGYPQCNYFVYAFREDYYANNVLR